jgi:hypothetical protein
MSPFSRGEWSTEILPQPLRNVWDDAEDLANELPMLVAEQTALWYLGTPETKINFDLIIESFRKLEFTGVQYPIIEPVYSSARFKLWCFERIGSESCAPRHWRSSWKLGLKLQRFSAQRVSRRPSVTKGFAHTRRSGSGCTG